MRKLINEARNFLLKQAIKHALKKPAPQLIPRSLPKAARVDCFVISLNAKDSSWSVLIEGFSNRGYIGKWLENDTYASEVSILPSAVESATFECTHFIGPYEFSYKSAASMLWQELICLPYINVYQDRYSQYRFNKLNLTRLDRIAILRFVYEATLENNQIQISSITLAGRLYSNRIFFHPDKTRMFNYCRLLLDSLVASEDLELKGAMYSLSSKALISLSRYEEDERRHKDMISQQRALKWLTGALILVGLIQAFVTYQSSSEVGYESSNQYSNESVNLKL